MNQLEYLPGIAGQSVQLDGPSAFVGIAEEMRSREWDYDLGYRDLVTATRPARTVDVTFHADYATADELRRVADADVMARTPGTFVAQNEWKQRGYILASDVDDIHYGRLSTGLKIALLDGAWWRLVKKSFIFEEPVTTYDSATGETVSTAGAADAPLHALTVDGKAVQDGTPSPDNPAEIQTVDGINLFDGARSGYLTGSSTSSSRVYHNTTNKGTYYYAPIDNDTEYTVTAWPADNIARFKLFLFKTDPLNGQSHATDDVMVVSDIGTLDQVTTRSFNSGEYNYAILGVGISSATYNPNAQAQLEVGSTATPYVPYGSIGLNIDGTITPIDLQGNVLASLPDGTHDELNVDSNGAVTITKRVGYTNQATTDGISATVGTDAISSTGTLDDGADVYYKLTTEQTITLTSITMPTVTNDSQVSIVAAVAPTITAEWQTSPDVYLDYPHDYPHDYQATAMADVTPGVLTPSDVYLVVYGPAVNPYIIVGGNRYQVNVSVPAGGYLVADGREKTIMLTLADGTVQNVFSSGVRGSGAGGGSYIFEQIPAGTNEVTYDGSFGFDLGWYEEEGEPPWSQS